MPGLLVGRTHRWVFVASAMLLGIAGGAGGERHRRRNGVTLMDALVVIGIVGLLASLALPAVMMARAASLRANCAGKLKSIGVALSAYESAFGCFPSAQAADFNDWRGLGASKAVSALVRLLPFLEQDELYARLNIDAIKKDFRPINTWERSTVPQFVCPAEPPPRESDVNYRVSLGPSPYSSWLENYRNYPEGATGAFVATRWMTRRDFLDGLSQTVGFSEKVRGDRDDQRYSWPGDYFWTGFKYPPYPGSDGLIERCATLDPVRTAHRSDGGSSWFYATFEQTFFNHVVTTNNRQVHDCSIQYREMTDISNYGGVFSASSLHSGGVNVLFMDGSLRFISESIALDVWRAIGTRKGGETVSL